MSLFFKERPFWLSLGAIRGLVLILILKDTGRDHLFWHGAFGQEM